MHETSLLWSQILSEPDHRKEIKVKINGTEYGMSRIIRVSVVGRLFDAPGVGNAFSRTLGLKIVPYDGPNGRIPPLSEIRLFARLVSADGQRVSEYIPKGVFYSDEAKTDTVTGAVSVTAFDAIMKMNVLFGVPKKGGGYGPVTTFTVSFNDGFYHIQKFRVASGGIMPTPTTPTHDGERFLAWYPDPLETPTVTRDMRFTAQWAQKHTVVFAFPLSLDSGPIPNQQFSSFEGEPTPMPIAPETPGYRLTGWLPELEFVVTGDMLYTAVFSEIAASGDYWNLYDDGTIIFDIPPDGTDGMTPEEIWEETLTEIAPHIDDITTVVITNDTPLPPEILAELVETLTNLEEIVLPPNIDLEEILGLIDVDLDEIVEIIDDLTVARTASYPLKVDYVVNEPLDYTGLQVMKRLSGGMEQDITADCVIFPSEGTQITESGDITVKIVYNRNVIGAFDLTVLDAEAIIAFGDWWELYADGTLNIHCVGDMPNYTESSPAPWHIYSAQIHNIEFSDSVTSIGKYAFWRLYWLENVTIPANIRSIGGYAFANCVFWRNLHLGGSDVLTISDGVRSIEEDAFFGFDGLIDLTIPGSATIGSFAFNFCYSLRSVTFLDGVRYIGEAAFYHCLDLANIIIPLSVTSIGFGAFYECDSLSDVYYEGSQMEWEAVSIVTRPHYGDYNEPLHSATIHYGTPEWATLGNNGLLSIERVGDMPNYTTSSPAPWYSKRSSVTSVSLSDETTSIGAYTFYGCYNLTSITIPDNVTSIGEGAFYGSKITNIIIPHGVTSIGKYTFSGCSSLTSVTIPDSVTSIEEGAFRGCSKLTNIVIPDSVTSIGDGAFSNCSSLANVTIPDTITSIGAAMFDGCFSLANITIPSGVTEIGDSAFNNCRELTSITIPSGVTEIGNYVFSYCESLESINIPNGVTSIGDFAFDCCFSLKSVTIADSVTTIGDNAFGSCYELTSMTIPNNVTSIGNGVFGGCYSLKNINIPSGVTEIGGSAFNCCSALTSITIPNNVLSIGEYAFSQCSALESIVIPNSVTSIGEEAFYRCAALESVTISNSVDTIQDGMFAYCTALESITIPNSVDTIKYWAFLGCSSLTSVAIPSSVTSIRDSAFKDCSALANVKIPNSVTDIEDWAFYDTALTSVAINSSATVAENAFPDNCVINYY